uniref:Calx-beta domain-containing protein n=1 Tax=Strigamia maritima TaxID=126957 RepID=T1JBM0_STRMM
MVRGTCGEIKMKKNYYLYNETLRTGLLLPILAEHEWSVGARATTYFIGMIYCFLGVAIIADIFMCSIEKITSKTRKIRLSTPNPNEPEVIEVKVWNDTVANLTLMALGSSAPEILLSCIETIGNGFKAGELGPGTIVGSAAFNLLIITGFCMVIIPTGETRPIKNINVFATTAFFCVFAYIWLLIVLVVVTPNVVDLWEAVLTFLLFPICVICAYMADKNLCRVKKIGRSKQLELGFTGDKDKIYFKDGKLNRTALIAFVKEVKKYPGLSDEDAAVLAASKLSEQQPHSRMWYRIGAVREMTGSRKTVPKLNDRLREICDVIGEADGINVPYPPSPSASMKIRTALVEFHSASCAVLESAGKVIVIVERKGNIHNKVEIRVETIDGAATAEEDYVPIDQIIVFEPNEVEKEVEVEIIDDNAWEPDEEFFLRISVPAGMEDEVVLGRVSIMEIVILNDDEPGILQFKKRGLLIEESVGVALIPVIRKNGADGDVSVQWRTIDKTAINSKDFEGGKGELHFKHGELELNIEIPIINDMDPEKDEHFEIELFEPTGGAQLGNISRITVTITNDDTFNSVMNKMMMMTNANMDLIRVESETWAQQFKSAMVPNGGDLENATWTDYVLHLLTFGWKVLFALVPPPSLLGGWLCFAFSLGMIGLLTAIVGDLASHFGKLCGLPDNITAITFVAAGTSLPDLFASKAAARQEKYADSAIGNVTGSNSVNVFLGLGLPWLISSIYWFRQEKEFQVDAGSLAFSVAIYTVASTLCIIVLLLRRKLNYFGKAELGGPVVPKYLCGLFCLILWLIYIILSSLQALKVIHVLS